jgi:diguanylate cyclase (GGDEF)-like protein
MTSLHSSINENTLRKIPNSIVELSLNDANPSYKAVERVLGTTVAMLNQTQAELEASRIQIESLKEQLRELELVATTDMLTGLKNRRGFDDNFSRELDRTRRGKSIGGVLVVIDLDSFKAINDTYGHQAGDACLQLVAKVLENEIRIMDTASRLGGDEFVLLMTDSTQELLLTRVQNIAWKLNHLTLDWQGQSIAINASVGMKPYHKGDNAGDIFAEADQSMYLDKKRVKKIVSQ